MNKENIPYLSIKNLSYYRDSTAIFDSLSINIKKGDIVAILGPSGTGKTTLLRLISGQLKPMSGSIYVNNNNICQVSRKSLYKLRKKMGLLFQSGALFSALSVYDNIAFPYREQTNLDESSIKYLVKLKLEAVGLSSIIHYMPNELSGGMSKRVALARAIALDPSLMMYDEPFTGQDPITTSTLLRLMKKLNSLFKMTSLIVSHDVPEVFEIADYVYVLSNGGVVAKGTVAQIKASKNSFVQKFVHGASSKNESCKNSLVNFLGD